MRTAIPPLSNRIRLATVALLSAAIGISACRSRPVPSPDEGSFSWTTYTNERLGYALEVPDIYEIEGDEGADVRFHWRGRIPLKITLVDAEKGRKRGLWPAHEPARGASLGGVPASLYEYDHWDGPLVSAMVSYVVPYRGEELGLEFRSEGELHELNRRILASFRFTD